MIPVPGPVAPPPHPPQWYGPPLAVPQTSRLHAVCRLSPQLRAICCVWVMSSLVCGLFASIWDLRFLICRLLEASMHFCLYYVLIPRHVWHRARVVQMLDMSVCCHESCNMMRWILQFIRVNWLSSKYFASTALSLWLKKQGMTWQQWFGIESDSVALNDIRSRLTSSTWMTQYTHMW